MDSVSLCRKSHHFKTVNIKMLSTNTTHMGQLASVHRFVSIIFAVLLCELECGPMPNVMDALPNIGGALCSMPQSLAHAHC